MLIFSSQKFTTHVYASDYRNDVELHHKFYRISIVDYCRFIATAISISTCYHHVLKKLMTVNHHLFSLCVIIICVCVCV